MPRGRQIPEFYDIEANGDYSNAVEPFSQSPNASTTSLTHSYKGVEHFSETAFVFNNPSYYGPDPEYAALAKQMSGFWVNFVAHGNPTPNGTSSGVTWESYYVPSNNTLSSSDGNRGGEDIVGKIVVMRTKSRGGVVQDWNDWRLAGREFLVQTMREVYGE